MDNQDMSPPTPGATDMAEQHDGGWSDNPVKTDPVAQAGPSSDTLSEARAKADLTTAIATCEAAGYGVVKRRAREEWVKVWNGMHYRNLGEKLGSFVKMLNLIAPDPDPLREALIAEGLSGEKIERVLAAVRGVG